MQRIGHRASYILVDVALGQGLRGSLDHIGPF
jgi:hypothetical protein